MRVLVCIGLWSVIGCSNPSVPDSVGTEDESNDHLKSEQSDNKIEVFGSTWTLKGPTSDTGPIVRLGMRGYEFFGQKTSTRLLVLTRIEDAAHAEGVFQRIMRVQEYRYGQWINHGPAADDLIDGSYSESLYVENELDGVERCYFSGGQLNHERNWKAGKQEGRSRCWYEDGKPQYDVVYADDKEISGKAWGPDGREY